MTVIATPKTIDAIHLTAALASTPVEFEWFEYEGSESPRVEPAADEFLNPILAGSYPDPSICRVGDEYFLINSTFAWYPGVPIFRSKDLVNWSQVGHVLDRPSQLGLDGLGVSEGIFAATIQYHGGLFYVITTIIGGPNKNFYVTARDPSGPWSEPHWLEDVDGIDPSFFFDDDGRVYVAHNGCAPDNRPLYEGHRTLRLHQFDMQSGTTRPGLARIIVNGGSNLARQPVWIEGPHLFKRDGFYYLCAAEGGTGRAHSQVIFRSRDIWGPYEAFERPILTQRHLPESRPNPITCTGHADLVETRAGEWWAVFLGSRCYEGTLTNLDRETFMLPMRWENGWPIILNGEEAVPRIVKRPKLPPQPAAEVPHNGSFTWRDDFDSKSLSPVWNFLRTPREAWYSLAEKPGALQIQPRAIDLASQGNPSLVARRLQHANFTASTMLSLNDDPRVDAGLVAFRNEKHYFFLGTRVDSHGRREVFLESFAGKKSDNGPEMIARAPLPSGAKTVAVKVNGEGRNYSFAYRAAEGDWSTLKPNADGSILSTDVAGGFVGTYLGMFARIRT